LKVPVPGAQHRLQLDDGRAGGRQEQADELERSEALVQEDDGEHGDLDRHRVVHHARFDRGERAQGVIPEGEGEGGVYERQPADDQPSRRIRPWPALEGDPDAEQDEGAHRHACRGQADRSAEPGDHVARQATPHV
jgi:hypothetical protein